MTKKRANYVGMKLIQKAILIIFLIYVCELLVISILRRSPQESDFDFESSSIMLTMPNITGIEMNNSLPIWAPNIKFTIDNSNHCYDEKIYILIAVHSKVSHFSNRLYLRLLFNEMQNYVDKELKIIFFVAQTTIPEIQVKLNIESYQYKDIAQGSFVDNYRTMTYKHLSTMKWVTEFCSHAKYILKLDDDVFFNLPTIIRYLSQLNSNLDNQICCKIYKDAHPIRGGKYKVTLKEYGKILYPDFCQGMAYITTPIVYKKLLLAVKKIDYLWLDDVLVTGISRRKSNVSLIDFSSYSLYIENESLDQVKIENLMFFSSNKDSQKVWPKWMKQIEAKFNESNQNHKKI